jgi:hypothetical protein
MLLNHGIYLLYASCNNQTRQEMKSKNEWGEKEKVYYFLLIYTVNNFPFINRVQGKEKKVRKVNEWAP